MQADNKHAQRATVGKHTLVYFGLEFNAIPHTFIQCECECELDGDIGIMIEPDRPECLKALHTAIAEGKIKPDTMSGGFWPSDEDELYYNEQAKAAFLEFGIPWKDEYAF